jgi:hypothetical protein
MSRPKIETSGKPAGVLWRQFSLGKDHPAIALAHHWRQIFALAKTAPKAELKIFAPTPKPKKGTAFVLGDRSPLNYFAVRETENLLGMLQRAIASRDGSEFRRLADAIETPDSADDALREHLVVRFFDLASIEIPPKQIAQATSRQIQKELEAAKIIVDEKQIRRACKQLGIKLSKGKPGRPETRTKTKR